MWTNSKFINTTCARRTFYICARDSGRTSLFVVHSDSDSGECFCSPTMWVDGNSLKLTQPLRQYFHGKYCFNPHNTLIATKTPKSQTLLKWPLRLTTLISCARSGITIMPAGLKACEPTEWLYTPVIFHDYVGPRLVCELCISSISQQTPNAHTRTSRMKNDGDISAATCSYAHPHI